MDRSYTRREFLRLGGFGAVAAAAASKGFRSAPTAGGVSVVDQRGVKIHLDHPARRVVTIPEPAASMVIAMAGSAAPLAGMNKVSEAAVDEGILGVMFPQAKRIPDDVAGADFAPNVESILNLHPDVVVQWADHGDAIITPLEEAGLNVVGLDYGTQADLVAWVNIFGTMLGVPGRSHYVTSTMAQVLAQLRGEPKPASPPSILYLFTTVESLRPAGRGTYNDFYIKLVGAKNAAEAISGTEGAVDPEQVLAWDPDIILIGNFDSGTPAKFASHPAFKSLSAVKARTVYKVPLGGYRWDPPSQESTLMWRWLYELVQPSSSTGDLRAQLKVYYKFLYNYTPSDPQVDQILWMGLNASAANYGRFKS
jgi:iron complex transport system substrate-binding protein